MTETQIRNAVARGQGRAILFLRQVGGKGYEELILRLCSRDQTYDSSTEDRTHYMGRLAETHPRPFDLVKPLGDRLLISKNRDDRDQIRGILGHLRELGSKEAREILLLDFKRFRLKERPFRWAMEHLGFEGLELVLGESHRLEDWEIKWIHDDAVEMYGKKRASEAFTRLGSAKVAEAIDPNRTIPTLKHDPPINVPEALELVLAGKFVPRSAFEIGATDEDWKNLAQLGMTSTDADVLRRIRNLFIDRPWPLDIGASLKEIEGETVENLRWFRLDMLSYSRSPLLRSWALHKLSGGRAGFDTDVCFSLLRLNAERQDRSFLTNVLFKLRNHKNQFHSVGFDILNLRCGATTEMLQLIYEYSPCGTCRGSAVDKLVNRRAVTPELRSECVEDSDKFTRRWARRSLRNVGGRK